VASSPPKLAFISIDTKLVVIGVSGALNAQHAIEIDNVRAR
jgi:hypothetical protein